MENSNHRLQIVQNAIHVIGLTMAVALDMNIRGALKIPGFITLLCTGLIFLFFWLIDYNKKNIFVYIIVTLLIVIGSLFLFIRQINLFKEIIKWKDWFLVYQQTEEGYRTSYAFAILVLLILVTVFITYFLNRNVIAWYSAISFVTVILIYCMVQDISVNKATIAIVITFSIQIIVEICNARYNKKSNGIKRNRNLYMLPLCMIIGMTAVLLPSNEKPIQWTGIRQFASAITDKADDIAFFFTTLGGEYSGEYGVSFVGYSDRDSDKLGGTVQNSDRILLKVKPTSRAYGRTYLVGNVSDKYVSDGWERSNLNLLTDQEASVDYYEMLLGLYQHQVMPELDEELLHSMSLIIRYQKIRTKTIFYPMKAFNLDVDNRKISYDESKPAILASRFLKKGFSYQLNYDEVNYAGKTIQDYLRNISKVNHKDTDKIGLTKYQEEDCRTYLKQIAGISMFDTSILNDSLESLLDQRASVIEQYYTQLPNQVTSRVYDLTKEITASYDNNYDKLKAIESYLAAMRYTKTPTETKEGDDFVDYFLFHQKEGYCTYFATAMAVMGRCIGVPTRYVEGVVVDYKKKEKEQYLVNSNSSHAWVEAYIKGFGWVPFEPTPNMRDSANSAWAKTNTGVSQIQPVPTPYMQGSEEIQIDNQQIKTAKEKEQHTFYLVRLCLVIMILISVLLVGVIALLGYNRKKRYHLSSRKEKIIYLIHDMIDLLVMDGHQMQESETVLLFATELNDNYSYEAGSFLEMVLIYQKLRYGDQQPEEAELKKVEHFSKQLKSDLSKKLGWMQVIKYQLRSLVRNI